MLVEGADRHVQARGRLAHSDQPVTAGTHTGTLRGPAGEIAPTSQTVDAPFCSVYEFDEGKITSVHLFFDQADLLTQLGTPPGAGSSA